MKLPQVLKVADLRRRLAYTFMIILVYSILLYVPIPFATAQDTSVATGQSSFVQNILDTLLSLTGGGGLNQLSILALGIAPYITASIIVQLLQMDVIPKMAEWNKQGQAGRDKASKATRRLAIVLGFIQGYGLATLLDQTGQRLTKTSGIPVSNILWDKVPYHPNYLYVAFLFTVGMAVLIWLGDRISKKGIGNGISVIILAGILGRLPAGIQSLVTSIRSQEAGLTQQQIILFIVGVLFAFLMLLLAVFLQLGERRLEVQYANRKNPFGHATTSYLPLKVNGSGVIPVIFVGAIMTLPDVINIFWPGNQFTLKFNEIMKLPTSSGVNGYSAIGIAVYSLLLYVFAFFYVTIQLDPVKISENIANSNGFIVGYKPGLETENYVRKVINRITVLGGFLLVVIAVTPLLVQTGSYYYAQSVTANTELIATINQFQVLFQFGGTGLLIVVSVIMQIYKRIRGRISVRNYEQFKLISNDGSKDNSREDSKEEK